MTEPSPEKHKLETEEASTLMLEGSKINRWFSEHTVNILEGIVQSQGDMVEMFRKIAEMQRMHIQWFEYILKTIDRIIFVLSFIVGTIIWLLFFQNPFNTLVTSIFPNWSNLSEGWRIAIFTLFASVPAAVIAGVVVKIVEVFVIDRFRQKTDALKKIIR